MLVPTVETRRRQRGTVRIDDQRRVRRTVETKLNKALQVAPRPLREPELLQIVADAQRLDRRRGKACGAQRPQHNLLPHEKSLAHEQCSQRGDTLPSLTTKCGSERGAAVHCPL